MTSVAILPVETASGETEYQAVSGPKRTVGRTAGEALDAMTAILTTNESGTLLVQLEGKTIVKSDVISSRMVNFVVR